MSWLSFIVASLIAGPEIGSFTAEQYDGGPILSLSTKSCQLGRAREIELSSAIRDYARLRGHCIAVRGWNRGRSIYRSRNEAQAAATPPAGDRRATLGIYGDETAMASLSVEPRQVVVAGIVGACEVINQGEGSAGYCHSVIEGGFLILGELRPQR